MRNFFLASGFVVLLSSGIPAAEPSAVAVGEPAPEISLTGIDGESFQLSDITGGGKHVALMFSRAHW